MEKRKKKGNQNQKSMEIKKTMSMKKKTTNQNKFKMIRKIILWKMKMTAIQANK